MSYGVIRDVVNSMDICGGHQKRIDHLHASRVTIGNVINVVPRALITIISTDREVNNTLQAIGVGVDIPMH